MARRQDTDTILTAIDNARRELGDNLAGGLAELRHDNTQLRDQLLEAIRDSFGALRAENLELRARLDRATVDLGDMRLQIETMRTEATQARLSALQPTAGPETPDDPQQLLKQAAGIAYATLHCHRDTWDFLVAQAAQAEHFRLPGDVEETDEDGLIDVNLSGRSLIAVLDALWHTQRSAEAAVGTRALAWQLYERIATAIGTVAGETGSDEETEPDVVRITIDDRP